MRDTDIIQVLRSKLAVTGGRHLYGILGTYPAIEHFAQILHQAKTPDGHPFPLPLSVNRGILDAIPDEEFRRLVLDEAKRPEPTFASVTRAFESFLRLHLRSSGLIVLASLEMLFAYRIELNLLRTMAADDYRILLLLPGKRAWGKVVLFADINESNYTLPANLIAENHLWEVDD